MAEKRTSQERFLQTKMYDVTLKLDPADVKEEIKTVGVLGEFLFYWSNLKGNTDEQGMVEFGPRVVAETREAIEAALALHVLPAGESALAVGGEQFYNLFVVRLVIGDEHRFHFRFFFLADLLSIRLVNEQ